MTCGLGNQGLSRIKKSPFEAVLPLTPFLSMRTLSIWIQEQVSKESRHMHLNFTRAADLSNGWTEKTLCSYIILNDSLLLVKLPSTSAKYTWPWPGDFDKYMILSGRCYFLFCSDCSVSIALQTLFVLQKWSTTSWEEVVYSCVSSFVTVYNGRQKLAYSVFGPLIDRTGLLIFDNRDRNSPSSLPCLPWFLGGLFGLFSCVFLTLNPDIR